VPVVGAWKKAAGGKVRVYTNARPDQRSGKSVDTFALADMDSGRAVTRLDAPIAYGDAYAHAQLKWCSDASVKGKDPTPQKRMCGRRTPVCAGDGAAGARVRRNAGDDVGGDGAGAGADPAVLAAVLADARLPLAAGTAPNRQSYAEAAMAAAAAAKAAHDDATHALRRCALLRFARAARLFLWGGRGRGVSTS